MHPCRVGLSATRHVLARARERLLSPVGLALFTLVTASCFSEGSGCNVDFDNCEHDSDCGAGFVCDQQAFGLGLSCVPATECQTDDDCALGESCVQRPPTPLEHPFEPTPRSKSVCECPTISCGGTSSSSSTTASSSSSSSSSASGSGGGGAGADGGAGAGGLAGAGGEGTAGGGGT